MSECSGSVQRSVAITVPNRRSDSISAHDHASGLDGTCFFNALIMFFFVFFVDHVFSCPNHVFLCFVWLGHTFLCFTNGFFMP